MLGAFDLLAALAAEGHGVAHGHLLWRGHTDGTVHLRGLYERQLRITGTRGQIENQIIEFTPFDTCHELLNKLGDHRPA